MSVQTKLRSSSPFERVTKNLSKSGACVQLVVGCALVDDLFCLDLAQIYIGILSGSIFTGLGSIGTVSNALAAS